MLERLDQLQFHYLGQAADIVMRFDHRTGTAEGRTRLDQIWIKCPLRQKFHVFDLTRFRVKHFNKSAADDFAFLFGVGHTL